MKKLVLILSLTNSLFAEEAIMKETILVTGGAGYIGSHVAHLLTRSGYRVIILDNFVYNQPFSPAWTQVIHGDCGNKTVLNQIFTQYHIDAVMHFAALIAVGESVQDPAKYYENNVVNTLTLLNAMRAHNVKKFIFSSTAATYGIPQFIPLTEQHPKAPINPYGNTKLMIEYLLHDFARAYGLRFVIFRYFNAAGGAPEHNLFECFCPGVGTHVIPVALRAALNKTPFTIFGTDYQTPDGTCVRDYIHVEDIAQAHKLALHYLANDGASDTFNLGTQHGYSVKEIIELVQQVTGLPLTVLIGPRRAGDPSHLVADATKAHTVLGWQPTKSDLQSIITSAYKAECIRLARAQAPNPLARDLAKVRACLR